MKRLKIYCSVLLALSIICCGFVGAFASYSEYGLSYLQNPIYGVNGRIYYSTPYGFIIQCGEETGYANALIDGTGVKIPAVYNRSLSEVSRSGHLTFYNYNNDGELTSTGVMDVNGNILYEAYGYYHVGYINDNRFFCVTPYGEGIVDRAGNQIVPFGMYTFYYSTRPDQSLFYVTNENYDLGLLDADGNLILQYGQAEDIDILYSCESFIRYDRAANITYVFNKYGVQTAAIYGKGIPYPNGLIEVSVEDYNTNKDIVYIYDANGNLQQTLEYTLNNKPYRWDNEFYKPANTYEYNSDSWNNVTNIVNKYTGQLAASIPMDDYYVTNVYNTGLIEVESRSTWQPGLIDLDGNVVLAPCVDQLKYNPDLGIFAYALNGHIYVIKHSPVEVAVNGYPVYFDQNPVVKDGRTLVPLRAIFEALGANVQWDAATSTVTATCGDKGIMLSIGSNAMYVNSSTITLDTPAEIIGGRTMVPVRAISEAFGCTVNWDASARKVLIYK